MEVIENRAERSSTLIATQFPLKQRHEVALAVLREPGRRYLRSELSTARTASLSKELHCERPRLLQMHLTAAMLLRARDVSVDALKTSETAKTRGYQTMRCQNDARECLRKRASRARPYGELTPRNQRDFLSHGLRSIADRLPTGAGSWLRVFPYAPLPPAPTLPPLATLLAA